LDPYKVAHSQAIAVVDMVVVVDESRGNARPMNGIER